MADLKGLSKDRLFSLRNEIIMSQKLNEEELDPIVHEAIARYTGRYVPSLGASWDIVLNEVYPIIQNQLPAIFFRNPRAFLKARTKTFITKKRNPVSGQMEEVQADSSKSAKTQEHILNYLITQKFVNYKRETRKTLLDALLFPYGILWHGYKGDFGMTEEQGIYIENEKIFVKRISPRKFHKDPSVTISDLDEAKWVAREIDVPINDLFEDKKLNVDKTRIKGFQGYGDKVGTATAMKKNIGRSGDDTVTPASIARSLLDFTDKRFMESQNSKFVKVFEVWLRPTKKEKREGKNGWVLLLTDEQEEPLRVSEWKVKAEGFPAILLQFNELNDAIFGIPDIDTYKAIADQKNIIINQQITNAQEMGKTWVGISKEGGSEEDIQQAQQGGNTIITFESGNPRDRMFVASGGGQGSSELYLIDQRIQQNLEDKSGVTDLKRGFLKSGEESATSVKLRAAGGGARPAYRQDIMSDFLKDSLLYLNQLNKQFMTVKDAVRIIGSLDVEWSEKPTKEEIQADIDVDIDVISMLPDNPQREIENLNQTLGLMVQSLTVPEVRDKLLQEGKIMTLTPIIEQLLLRQRINNPDVFRNIKPEEQMGFVSVQQMREAQANVQAALEGGQIPHPPTEQDDHRAKLEVYSSIQQLLQKANQQSEVLDQLIQIQTALLQAVQEKQPQAGQKVNLTKPQVRSV